jgi:hypothetical protein
VGPAGGRWSIQGPSCSIRIEARHAAGYVCSAMPTPPLPGPRRRDSGAARTERARAGLRGQAQPSRSDAPSVFAARRAPQPPVAAYRCRARTCLRSPSRRVSSAVRALASASAQCSWPVVRMRPLTLRCADERPLPGIDQEGASVPESAHCCCFTMSGSAHMLAATPKQGKAAPTEPVSQLANSRDVSTRGEGRPMTAQEARQRLRGIVEQPAPALQAAA